MKTKNVKKLQRTGKMQKFYTFFLRNLMNSFVQEKKNIFSFVPLFSFLFLFLTPTANAYPIFAQQKCDLKLL